MRPLPAAVRADQQPGAGAGQAHLRPGQMVLFESPFLFQVFFLGQVYFNELNGIKCKFSIYLHIITSLLFKIYTAISL